MEKLLQFVFLISVTVFFWKNAISGLINGKIEFGLRGKEKFNAKEGKAKFYGFLFLTAAIAMTWATISLLQIEY